MFSLICCLWHATSSPSTELQRQSRKACSARYAEGRVTSTVNDSVMVRLVVRIHALLHRLERNENSKKSLKTNSLTFFPIVPTMCNLTFTRATLHLRVARRHSGRKRLMINYKILQHWGERRRVLNRRFCANSLSDKPNRLNEC